MVHRLVSIQPRSIRPTYPDYPPLPEAAPAGPINGPEDFRQRHPDGRMGSDPFLAQADHGAAFLELAATALAKDLRNFLAEASAPLP